MNGRIIGALVAKDLTLYFRDRFFAFITVIGLVAYIAIYLVMPSAVDEDLRLAVYAPSVPDLLFEVFSENGVALEAVESEEALQAAVETGEYAAGVVLPEDVLSLIRGDDVTITAYLPASGGEALSAALTTVLRLAFNELSYSLRGQALNLNIEEEVLGQDMVGQQVAFRDRMLPLLAVFILIIETMGLAALITSELETRTLKALLVTPVSLPGVFLAKGIIGVGLAFTQVVILMLATQSLGHEPLLLLLTLFIGAIFVTGLAFLISSVATDLMSVFAWSILAVIILAIPSFGVLIPGTVTDWAQLIPSYYLVDTVYEVVNLGGSWADVGMNLLILSAFSVATLGLGMWVLGRRVLS